MGEEFQAHVAALDMSEVDERKASGLPSMRFSLVNLGLVYFDYPESFSLLVSYESIKWVLSNPWILAHDLDFAQVFFSDPYKILCYIPSRLP
jgi:hypothetical protein